MLVLEYDLLPCGRRIILHDVQHRNLLKRQWCAWFVVCMPRLSDLPNQRGVSGVCGLMTACAIRPDGGSGAVPLCGSRWQGPLCARPASPGDIPAHLVMYLIFFCSRACYQARACYCSRACSCEQAPRQLFLVCAHELGVHGQRRSSF